MLSSLGYDLEYSFLYSLESGVVCIDSSQGSPTARIHDIKHLLSSIFLPQGYPTSVSDDYLEYQIWDTIQVMHFGKMYALNI